MTDDVKRIDPWEFREREVFALARAALPTGWHPSPSDTSNPPAEGDT